MHLGSYRLGMLHGQYFCIFEKLGMFDKLCSGKFASLSPTPMHIHYDGPTQPVAWGQHVAHHMALYCLRRHLK